MSRPPGRAVDISVEEQTAIRWRISQLRSEISRAEREVEALKVTLGRSKRPGLVGIAARASETLVARFDKSFTVLKRQVEKQADPIGFLALDTLAGLRLASNFSLAQRYLLQGPSLVTHSPAIYSRIALLEPYAPGLVSVVERWLPVIEPHLDEILDRLDDIEPHLLYIIDHIDTLAPHCGALLRHLDALLLYAEDQAWLPELIEYVPYYAPRLDALGPHLAVLVPHMPLLLPHMPVIARNVDAFLPHVSVSANGVQRGSTPTPKCTQYLLTTYSPSPTYLLTIYLPCTVDVLLFYFGWVLRVPLLRRVIFLPGVPRAIAIIARWLPRRPVRGRTGGSASCQGEGCDPSAAASAARYDGTPSGSPDVQNAVRALLRYTRRYTRSRTSGK